MEFYSLDYMDAIKEVNHPQLCNHAFKASIKEMRRLILDPSFLEDPLDTELCKKQCALTFANKTQYPEKFFRRSLRVDLANRLDDYRANLERIWELMRQQDQIQNAPEEPPASVADPSMLIMGRPSEQLRFRVTLRVFGMNVKKSEVDAFANNIMNANNTNSKLTAFTKNG